jgi:uncharacterized protein involved in outer membrane biogenesis
MKKLLKIFTYFIVVVITLVIALAITAKLAENKITDIALKKISESIEAPVIIDNVSFTLLRNFPLATIELNKVYLGSPKKQKDFDTVSIEQDTIISISKLYVSVKSRPLLKGIIEVMKVDVNGADINYTVDTSGVSNIDFLMDTTETVEEDTVLSEPVNLTLSDISFKNIVCNFNDHSLKTAAKIIIPNVKVKAKVDGDHISASVSGAVNLTNFSFEETNLYLMNNTDINFDVDYEDDSISIKQFAVDTDGAGLNLSGSVLLGENIETDLRFEGSDLIIDELIKYAPKEMLKEYGLNQVSGNMNFDGTVKGVYTDTEMPHFNVNLNLLNGQVATSDYPKLKNISFNGKVTNGILRNNQSTQIDFSSFHFETEQSKFDVTFSVLDIDHPKYNVKSNMEINVAEFSDFMPDSTVQYIDGNIKASISTKGELPDSIGDDFVDYVLANSRADIKLTDFNVDVDETLSIKNFSAGFNYKPNNFSVSNLNINIPAYNFELQNTSLNSDFYGSINNTAELSLNIKSYYIETKGAEISGFVKLKNLDKPSYDTETRIALNLQETKSMLPDSLVTALSGKVIIDIKSRATLNLDSITDQAIDAAFNKSTVNVEMNNITAILPDDASYKIENLSGVINMSPEVLKINKVRGIAAGLSFEIDSTEVWNSYETFVQGSKKEIFTVQTNIILGEINNSFLAAFMPAETTIEETSFQETKEESANNENLELTDTSATNYLLPDLSEFGLPHFLIRGRLAVNKLEYEKNIIDDISLKFRFADSLYVIDQFKFKTCGGQINTSLKLDARNWEKPVIDIKNYITGLDINQLLLLNDNFGDTLITHEKFSGILTSETHTRVFYQDGLWPTERIRAKGRFTIEEGRIYGYEPLVELSNNKLVGGLKELDKLEFNTLNTSYFMYKDNVYIPKTDVVNSSMDLSIFAMHSLQDDYEYHLKIHLGDVLTGKSDKLMKEQAKQNKKEGSTEERKGLRLVSLKLEDEKKNGFDNDKLEEEFKKKLNKQQGWLNLLFNPMLVNFSTDLDRTLRNKELLEKYGAKSEGN